MKIEFTDNCPLCRQPLTKDQVEREQIKLGYPAADIYSCPKDHYYYSYDPINHKMNLVAFFIPGFRVQYDGGDTTVWKVLTLPQSNWRYLYTVKGYLRMEWDNPQYLADKIKTLLVFS